MSRELTRIERVVHLQGVELFAYCTAEQMVRIAAIAHEERFAAGEKVYRESDPAETMYCVVEGEVRLGGGRRAGPRATFGVREILSGRLREEEACAEVETSVLAIDAEDFFDLLSNNVEIVKALFRQLLRRPLPPAAGVEAADEGSTEEARRAGEEVSGREPSLAS